MPVLDDARTKKSSVVTATFVRPLDVVGCKRAWNGCNAHGGKVQRCRTYPEWREFAVATATSIRAVLLSSRRADLN